MERKKEVTVGSPVTVAGVTVIPVSEVSSSYWHGKRGISFFGSKHPICIIVVSPAGKKAFRITGEEVPFDELTVELPGIREMLGEA